MKSVENKCVANAWFLVFNARRCDNLELDGSTKLAAIFETRGKWGLGAKDLGVLIQLSWSRKKKGKSELVVDI